MIVGELILEKTFDDIPFVEYSVDFYFNQIISMSEFYSTASYSLGIKPELDEVGFIGIANIHKKVVPIVRVKVK